MPKAETEVKFVKRSEMDQQSVLKMQRPQFKLDMDDVDIRNSAMLTDKHIQMAQELLHHQLPKIEGQLSPTIGKARQFPVMRTDFIQLLHTGGIHWVCVSNIGCKKKNQVKLYDSLYSGVSLFTNEQIAALLFIEDTVMSSKCPSLLWTSKPMEQTVVFLHLHLPQHSVINWTPHL